MKKLSFLISALAVTTLVGCGGGGNTPTSTVESTFNCSHCYLDGDTTKIKDTYNVNKGTTISKIITPYSGYKFDSNIDNVFYVTIGGSRVLGKDGYFTFSGNKFIIDSKYVTDNVSVHCTAIEDKPIVEKVNLTISCTNSYIGEDPTKTTEQSEIEKTKDISRIFTASSGYHFDEDPDNAFIVTIGGTRVYAKDNVFTFDGSNFAIDGKYITNDIVITCTAIDDPATKYQIEWDGRNCSTEDIPSEGVVEGMPLYLEIKSDDKYRMPADKITVKSGGEGGTDLHEWNPTTETGDYIYYYDQESDPKTASLLILPGVIKDKIYIRMDAIRQITITFNPDSANGHWPNGSTATITGTADIDKSINDALKNAQRQEAAYEPESNRKDEGYRFVHWNPNDSAEVIYGGTKLTEALDGLTLIARYDLKKYIISIDASSFPGLDVDTSLKSFGKTEFEHKKEDIVGQLTPQPGKNLPHEIQVYRTNSSGEQELLKNNKDYFYDNTASEKNFRVPAENVTGNFSIHGKCSENITVTFSAGEGEWQGSAPDPVIFESSESLTIKDVMLRAGLTEQNLPIKSGAKFVYWDNNGQPIYIGDINPITQNMNLVAKYSAVTFENDTWNNVATYANQGLSKLKEVYGFSETDSFVGLTRQIKVYSDTYTVRVIGENHDDTTAGNIAALTFEFTSAIKQMSYAKKTGSYTDSGNEYTESDLKDYLNNDLVTHLEPGSETFRDSIKIIKKKTLKGGKDKDTHLQVLESEEKMFALSGTEIGITNETPTGNPVPYTYNFFEGNVYSYYSLKLPSLRVKEFNFGGEEGSKAVKYWLRSPCPVGSDGTGVNSSKVYNINPEGTYSSSDARNDSTTVPYVCPAFAL